jgi:SAM-dependent methyltransferase
LLFAARLASDFQFNTLHRHMQKFVTSVSGNVADVGCGQGPFEHLLRPDEATYIGLDITYANEFGYNNPDAIHFDGKNIPFDTDSIDALVCCCGSRLAAVEHRLERRSARLHDLGREVTATV